MENVISIFGHTGTGPGMILSYEIINIHVGEIKLETKDGEGSSLRVGDDGLPYFYF